MLLTCYQMLWIMNSNYFICTAFCKEGWLYFEIFKEHKMVNGKPLWTKAFTVTTTAIFRKSVDYVCQSSNRKCYFWKKKQNNLTWFPGEGHLWLWCGARNWRDQHQDWRGGFDWLLAQPTNPVYQNHNVIILETLFLSDPGVPGVRSMGLLVSNKLRHLLQT